MQIHQILDQIYPLPQGSKATLIEKITEISWPKNHILLKADKVETKIYFIKSGIVRAYSTIDGDEITFWFGKEGETVISMRSYVENLKGYENIALLENCELYVITISDLQKLYQEDLHIANWGRKFAEKELIKTEERLISRQFRTATERYAELLANNPDLLKRVQLGHIASYLGITQVSLSRIRAKI